jgi:sugar-specific transcriptional regulator TrmB
MTIRPSDAADERTLDLLGISEPEEQAYRWLLGNPGATVQEAAPALRMPPRKMQRLLDALEAKGLATHAPERPRRYLPAPPNIAMEAMVLEHQDRLRRARTTIRELQEHAKSAQHNGSHEPIVELISSREAGRQVMEQIDRLAKTEIIALIRQPILFSTIDVDDTPPTQKEAIARGVRFRSIADTGYLALPGAVQRTWRDLRAGEDIRVFPNLPFKMLLADRRIAFIPLDLEHATDKSLLVRSSALLDALVALFEMLWDRAAPIAFSRNGEMHTAAAPIDPADDGLVSLLAAGLNDKTIAHELGISERTLGRRVGELMESLDARTRFQAGWLAALRLGAESGRDPG